MHRFFSFAFLFFLFIACAKEHSCVCEAIFKPIDSLGRQSEKDTVVYTVFPIYGEKYRVDGECKKKSWIVDSSEMANGIVTCYLEE